MFQQRHRESLSEAWTHFKDLLQKVHHHGIDLWLKVQIFYDHVNPITRRTIDQSASGKLRDRNAKESWYCMEQAFIEYASSRTNKAGGVDLGEVEAPYWTMLRKRESYKPCPSLDGLGTQIPYYARKDFLDCHFLEEWEIVGDAEIKDLINNPIKWNKPSKKRDGAWHAKIRLIDPDEEEFTKTLQSIPTIKKLSKRESPWEIIDLDHFYDTSCVIFNEKKLGSS
uniref:Zinc finger, CCHC-type n=1 Tax=Tanacetum cinerariifolium TaxID=118510 RepID=A0A6L2K2L0_TANCI|nr:zinc finger, CCHC-type [Tanacetum cinerariifolium]